MNRARNSVRNSQRNGRRRPGNSDSEDAYAEFKRASGDYFGGVRALLRSMRETAGLTQRDLAKRIGIHATMVHRSETGDPKIDPVEFADWCRACGEDPGDAIRKLGRK